MPNQSNLHVARRETGFFRNKEKGVSGRGFCKMYASLAVPLLSAKCTAGPNILGFFFVSWSVTLGPTETPFAKTPFSWFLTSEPSCAHGLLWIRPQKASTWMVGLREGVWSGAHWQYAHRHLLKMMWGHCCLAIISLAFDLCISDSLASWMQSQSSNPIEVACKLLPGPSNSQLFGGHCVHCSPHLLNWSPWTMTLALFISKATLPNRRLLSSTNPICEVSSWLRRNRAGWSRLGRLCWECAPIVPSDAGMFSFSLTEKHGKHRLGWTTMQRRQFYSHTWCARNADLHGWRSEMRLCCKCQYLIWEAIPMLFWDDAVATLLARAAWALAIDRNPMLQGECSYNSQSYEHSSHTHGICGSKPFEVCPAQLACRIFFFHHTQIHFGPNNLFRNRSFFKISGSGQQAFPRQVSACRLIFLHVLGPNTWLRMQSYPLKKLFPGACPSMESHTQSFGTLRGILRIPLPCRADFL